MFQSDAASAHRRPSLVCDNRVPAVRFQSVCPGSAVMVWFHTARGESERCILLWCLAAETVAARHLSSCWRLLLSSAPRIRPCTTALSCCDTRLRTSHLMWPTNRPNLNPVDYRIWTDIQECIYQKQQKASNIVDELWLVINSCCKFSSVSMRQKLSKYNAVCKNKRVQLCKVRSFYVTVILLSALVVSLQTVYVTPQVLMWILCFILRNW